MRQQAGIGFDGGTYGESFVLADVRLEANVAIPQHEVILFFSTSRNGRAAPPLDGVHRIVATVDDAPEARREYVQALLDTRAEGRARSRARGALGVRDFAFTIASPRPTATRRVLLAGDAAHVHSPAGGQGMNVGIQDAVALADALAAVLGGEPDALLDDYSSARRPIAKGVVRMTDRLTRLATLPRAARPIRNAAISLVGRVPAVRLGALARNSSAVWSTADLACRPETNIALRAVVVGCTAALSASRRPLLRTYSAAGQRL